MRQTTIGLDLTTKSTRNLHGLRRRQPAADGESEHDWLSVASARTACLGAMYLDSRK